MASDSDLFQKRVYWGFGKTYRAACEGAPAVDLAPSIVRAVRNALKGDLRCPSLKSLVACASQFASLSEGGLFRQHQLADEAEFRARLDVIERTFADFESTRIARQAIEAAGYDLAQNPDLNAEDVCYERVAKQFLERYGLDPMQSHIARSRSFTREQMERYREETFSACKDQLIETLKGVARSAAGIPGPRRKEKKPDINTLQGLNEPIGVEK
jgi:hypothetical protein